MSEMSADVRSGAFGHCAITTWPQNSREFPVSRVRLRLAEIFTGHYTRDMNTEPFAHENTPAGAYGEFEPVPADVDWDDHDEQMAAEIAAFEAAEGYRDDVEMGYYSDVEMGVYDDDPNPYHGDYSEM